MRTLRETEMTGSTDFNELGFAHPVTRGTGWRVTDMSENMVASSQFTGNFEEVRATVAARLRAARKAKGYTQKDLATRVDTSQTYISDLENCAINPSMLMLFRLTEVLEVEMATLFEGVQNE